MSSRIKLVGILAALEAFFAVSVLADPFSPTTNLSEARYGHSLVGTSGFLYNIGGLGGTSGVSTAQKVFYVPIQNSGNLGTWTEGTPLPEAVFFHSSVLWNNTVYVLGGYHYRTGVSVSNVVYYSRLNADGSVGSWRTAAPLPQSLYFLSAAVWNGTIYVTGGTDGQTLSNNVYSADIQSDGSLGPWNPQRALPERVYTHVAVSQGTLYVLGGVVNNGTLVQNTVYYARINPDKTLNAWSTTTPLPQPLSNHGAVMAGGRIYVTGGWTGSAPTNAAVSATIASDGTLSAWSSFATLATPLYLHAEAATDKCLYVSGGTNGQNPQSAVYVMPLPLPVDRLPPRTTLTVGVPRYGNAPPFIANTTPLSLSAVDDALVVGDGQGVGVQSTQYAVDRATFAAYQTPFTIGSDGFHWVNFFSTDKVGNTEAVHSSSVAVDGTPPVSSLAVGSPRALLASGGTVVSPSTQLSVTANDPVVNGVASGISQVLYGIDAAALAPVSGNFTLPSPDGAHTIRMQARDNLQNTETPHQTTLYLDGTAPVTTVSATPAPYVGANGIPILNAASLVSFSAVDPVNGGIAAGVNHTEYVVNGGSAALVSGTFVLPEGMHALSYRSIDNVGNAEVARSATYWVDATPPLTTLSVGSPSISLFNVDMITPQTPLTLSAQDPVSNGVTSGVSKIVYSLDGGAAQVYANPLQLNAGRHIVSYGAVDNAGNAEAMHSIAFYVGPFLTDTFEGMESASFSGLASVSGVLRTNGAFNGTQGSVVNGDVTAMTVNLSGGSRITGTVAQGVATLPAQILDLSAARTWASSNNNNASVPPQFISNGALVLGAQQQLTLSAGTYLFSGLTIGGGARLAVSGRVNLFLSGPLTMNGGGLLNDSGTADNLWIVSDASSSGLSDGARAAFNLYAPLATVSLIGNGDFTGRIMGRTVSVIGVLDILPPRTTLTVGAPRYGNAPPFIAYATPLSLSAVDDALTVGDGKGVGVQSTQYAVDGATFSVYQNPITVGIDGFHWLRFFSVDKVGNSEAVRASSVAVDGTPPVSSLVIGSPQALLASGGTVVSPRTQLSVTANDPVVNGVASGVSQALMGMDAGPLTPASGNFTLPSPDGVHTIRLQASDNLQNTETLHQNTLYLDGTPPITSVRVTPAPYIGANGIPVLNATSLVSFSAVDPVNGEIAAGVHHTEFILDGGSVTVVSGAIVLGEGIHALSYRSIDNVGNAELLRSAAYWVDTTPPLTTLSVGSPSISLFNVDMITPQTPLTLSAQDPVSNGVASGVAHTVYGVDGGADQVYSGPFQLSAGTHTVSYASVDNAGNAEGRHSVSVSVGSFLADALAGFDGIRLSGTSSVTGTARTNGAFVAGGRATVNGDVYAMTARLKGRSSVTGTIHQGQATLPPASFDLDAARAWIQVNNDNGSIPAEFLRNGSLSLESRDSLTLPEGNYYVTGINMSGRANLGVSGRVNIFVHGPISITGRGRLNDSGDAANLWIVCDAKDHARVHSQGDVDEIDGDNNNNDDEDEDSDLDSDDHSNDIALKGHARAALHLYAPLASVLVKGHGVVAGRILGRFVSMSGKAMEPSTSVLPSPTHDPGSVRHLPCPHPELGSGTATRGRKGDRDEDIVSSRLDLDAPAPASIQHDVTATPTIAPPLQPGHSISDESSSQWHARGPSAPLPPVAHSPGPVQHLEISSPSQGHGTATNGRDGDKEQAVLLSRLEQAPPDTAPMQHDGTAISSQASAGGSSLMGLLTASHVMPPIELSSHTVFSLVSSQGNTVRSRDHSAVVIPPDATSSSLGVTVTTEKAPDDLERQRREAAASRKALKPAGSGVEFGPEGTHFSKPVTVEIPYDRSLLPPGTDESSLVVHYWNQGKGDWEALASIVDTQAQIVRAQTDHFSLYKAFSGAGGAAAPSAAGFGFGDVYSFPNPARSGQNPTIHVEAGSADQIEIRIYDLSGELRHSASLNGPQNAFEYTWNVGGAGSGIYMYIIKASKQGVGSISTKGKLAVIK